MGLFSKTKQGFLGSTQHALAELQDLGARAARASTQTLERLSRQPLSIEQTTTHVAPRARTAHALSHHADTYIAARFPIGGAAPGTVATLFSKKDALELVALLLGREAGAVKKLGELERSAIAEMTNIALNAAVTALATHGGVRFDTGVPSVESPPKDLELFFGYDAGAEIDHSLIVETRFCETGRDISGTLVMVFGLRGHQTD